MGPATGRDPRLVPANTEWPQQAASRVHLAASPGGTVAAAGLHARGSGVPGGLQEEGCVTGHPACIHLHPSHPGPSPGLLTLLKGAEARPDRVGL